MVKNERSRERERRRRWMSTDSARMSRPFLTITLLFSLLRLSSSLSSSHLLHQSHRREALFSLRPPPTPLQRRRSDRLIVVFADPSTLLDSFSDEFVRESANVASCGLRHRRCCRTLATCLFREERRRSAERDRRHSVYPHKIRLQASARRCVTRCARI